MKLPIIKLANSTQISLCLIKEELKSRRLFQALHLVGLDDCYFQPHLDSLILRSVGLDDGTDETFEAYDHIIDRRCKKIEADNDSITKQALKVYMELHQLKQNIKSQRRDEDQY